MKNPIEEYDIRPGDLPPEYREIAEAIGMDAALTLVRIRGGEGIYVPKFEKISRAARDRAIRAEFNGANHRELARRHGLTVSWIYVIVGQTAPEKSGIDVIDNQMSLF